MTARPPRRVYALLPILALAFAAKAGAEGAKTDPCDRVGGMHAMTMAIGPSEHFEALDGAFSVAIDRPETNPPFSVTFSTTYAEIAARAFKEGDQALFDARGRTYAFGVLNISPQIVEVRLACVGALILN